MSKNEITVTVSGSARQIGTSTTAAAIAVLLNHHGFTLDNSQNKPGLDWIEAHKDFDHPEVIVNDAMEDVKQILNRNDVVIKIEDVTPKERLLDDKFSKANALIEAAEKYLGIVCSTDPAGSDAAIHTHVLRSSSDSNELYDFEARTTLTSDERHDETHILVNRIINNLFRQVVASPDMSPSEYCDFLKHSS